MTENGGDAGVTAARQDVAQAEPVRFRRVPPLDREQEVETVDDELGQALRAIIIMALVAGVCFGSLVLLLLSVLVDYLA